MMKDSLVCECVMELWLRHIIHTMFAAEPKTFCQPGGRTIFCRIVLERACGGGGGCLIENQVYSQYRRAARSTQTACV